LLNIDPGLSSKFPGLSARITRINGVSVKKADPSLEAFKKEVMEEVTALWKLDDLRDNASFRAYRDFFWRVKVDPTKSRPAAEALIRRILRGNPLPTINTLVDAYNLASVRTAIPLAAFDAGRLSGELVMREARAGEEFLGIGMNSPIQLEGGEPVVQDAVRLIAVYPHRDADHSKVTYGTSDIILMSCGVPGVSGETLESAEQVGVATIIRFCGGSETKV